MIMSRICFNAPHIETPYFNEWNRDVYRRRERFNENPMEILSSSTSGACVVLGGGNFAGLLQPVPARFVWDGLTLSIDAPEAALFYVEASASEAWKQYHVQLGLLPAPVAPHGHCPEYCTWVEQGWEAAQRGLPGPSAALESDFVRRYLDRVTRDHWPRGRFTIDEGWCPRYGEGGFGDWTPKVGLDMAALAAEIASAGHVPGLWLAPALLCPRSRRAQAQPELVGEPFSMTAESGWAGFAFLKPGDAARDYLAVTFRRAWDWGFRKLKLDLFYGPKWLMIELHQLCWEAAQRLPGPMELEGHVPDPFAARWVHVIRLNDVLIDAAHPDWRDVAEAHDRVCRESAPHHLLNLDHLGGNKPAVTELQWLEHAEMQQEQLFRGYPVISLLPEHVGARAVEATDRLLAPFLSSQSSQVKPSI